MSRPTAFRSQPTIVVVVDTDPKLKLNRTTLAERIAEHLHISRESIRFCGTTTVLSEVIRDILQMLPDAIVYYETPLSITERYKESVRKQGVKIPQLFVKLRGSKHSMQKSHRASLSDVLGHLHSLFKRRPEPARA